MKKIAFFDFDGTITTKDTLLEFIKFSKGTLSFYIGFLLNSPYLIAFKLKLISNQVAKEKILTYFFHNTSLNQFEQYSQNFVKQKLPALLRPAAIAEIKTLLAANTEVVIVSASPENWIFPWSNSLGLTLIATKLLVKDGDLTGKIQGKNCHGQEKVNRIVNQYNLAEYNTISAYGDSSGDKPMLALAHNPHYKPFR